MFTAYYSPASSSTDPSRAGFPSYVAAAEWIRKNCVCDDCRIMCANEDVDLMDSSCAAEWFIIETEKLEKCESFGDVLDAAGFTLESKKGQSQ